MGIRYMVYTDYSESIIRIYNSVVCICDVLYVYKIIIFRIRAAIFEIWRLFMPLMLHVHCAAYLISFCKHALKTPVDHSFPVILLNWSCRQMGVSVYKTQSTILSNCTVNSLFEKGGMFLCIYSENTFWILMSQTVMKFFFSMHICPYF